MADCVNWVCRLTLLDLRTNWTYEHALGTELVRMYETYCKKYDLSEATMLRENSGHV